MRKRESPQRLECPVQGIALARPARIKDDETSLKLQNQFFEGAKHPLDTKQSMGRPSQ